MIKQPLPIQCLSAKVPHGTKFNKCPATGSAILNSGGIARSLVDAARATEVPDP
jgi:hypothetical protein